MSSTSPEAELSELNRVLDLLIAKDAGDLWEKTLGPNYRRTFSRRQALSPKQLETLLRLSVGKDISPNLSRLPMTLATQEGLSQLFELETAVVERLLPTMSKPQLERWQAELGVWKSEYEAIGIRAGSLAEVPGSPTKYRERVLEWRQAKDLLERSGLPVELCYGSEIRVGVIFCPLRVLRAYVEQGATIDWLERLPKKDKPSFKKGTLLEHAWQQNHVYTAHHIPVRRLRGGHESTLAPLSLNPAVKWVGDPGGPAVVERA